MTQHNFMDTENAIESATRSTYGWGSIAILDQDCGRIQEQSEGRLSRSQLP